MWDNVRFAVSAGLMAAALFVMCSGVFGTWRFRYCLNRLHAAAVNDTLGLFLGLSSLIVAKGFSFVSLKFMFVLILLWIASPVSSHLIAQMEVRSAPDLKDRLTEKTLQEERASGENPAESREE